MDVPPPLADEGKDRSYVREYDGTARWNWLGRRTAWYTVVRPAPRRILIFIRAKHIMHATNGRTSLLALMREKIVPMRGHMATARGNWLEMRSFVLYPSTSEDSPSSRPTLLLDSARSPMQSLHVGRDIAKMSVLFAHVLDARCVPTYSRASHLLIQLVP